jgi:hypothetical protein
VSELGFAADVRDALVRFPASAATHGSDEFVLADLYVPYRHFRALLPDKMVVTGIRGSGKSLWWRALQDATARRVIAAATLRSNLETVSRVVPGFGVTPDPARYPDRDTIAALIRDHSARTIWRTVFLWGVADDEDALPDEASWAHRVGWVHHNPERVSALLFTIDQRCSARGETRLVVFDAIDRAAADWTTLITVLRGLLEVVLDVRERRSLRAKAFIRADMLSSPAARAFPDSSKVMGDAVALEWSPTDLYALLWQRLGNGSNPGAKAFLDLCRSKYMLVGRRIDDVWQVPDELARDADVQLRVFHHIAHPWMGTNHRRGDVYTWLPSHLADAAGQVSPRSFLAAVHNAAVDTPLSSPYALDWRAVRAGVQRASSLRLGELVEDHGWIEGFQEALRGLRVPCGLDELLSRLEQGAIPGIAQGAPIGALAPQHLSDGAAGLVKDLRELGVISMMRDGRVQVPDVYRIAFGMIRKGGVPPLET